MVANEIVAILFVLAIAGMVGFSMFKNMKENKARDAAVAMIKGQMAELERRLNNLLRK
jgi:predicted negative regulator of RcsB-dependent stress response